LLLLRKITARLRLGSIVHHLNHAHLRVEPLLIILTRTSKQIVQHASAETNTGSDQSIINTENITHRMIAHVRTDQYCQVRRRPASAWHT